MKLATFLAFAAVAVATPSPPVYQAPHKIDISSYPVVELASKSKATIVIESGTSGNTVHIYSADGRSRWILTIDSNHASEVALEVIKGDTTTKYWDVGADGLPDGRRIFSKKGDSQKLLVSERLQWTGTPDEYDPRSK